jgi:hypothetical protein
MRRDVPRHRAAAQRGRDRGQGWRTLGAVVSARGGHTRGRSIGTSSMRMPAHKRGSTRPCGQAPDSRPLVETRVRTLRPKIIEKRVRPGRSARGLGGICLAPRRGHCRDDDLNRTTIRLGSLRRSNSHPSQRGQHGRHDGRDEARALEALRLLRSRVNVDVNVPVEHCRRCRIGAPIPPLGLGTSPGTCCSARTLRT